MRLFVATVVLGLSSVAAAQSPVLPPVSIGSLVDATGFVHNAATSAKNSNYMGTLVYQRAGETETFRMVHVNDAGVERERLSTLDGAPKEMIRDGDRTVSYLPEQRLVRVQPMNERAFPSVSPEHARALLTYYVATDLGIDRIAGLPARGMSFVPRDSLRFAQQWWVDLKTGLPLRARYLNERNEVIEQVSFTDIQIETRVSRNHLRSAFAGKTQEWRTEVVPAAGSVTADTGWTVRELPPGFIKVREGVRAMGQGGPRVTHLLFSDGVATISVFIEQFNAGEPMGASQQGVMNVYRRQTNDVMITALGQTPAQTVKAIADAVARAKKAE